VGYHGFAGQREFDERQMLRNSKNLINEAIQILEKASFSIIGKGNYYYWTIFSSRKIEYTISIRAAANFWLSGEEH